MKGNLRIGDTVIVVNGDSYRITKEGSIGKIVALLSSREYQIEFFKITGIDGDRLPVTYNIYKECVALWEGEEEVPPYTHVVLKIKEMRARRKTLGYTW